MVYVDQHGVVHQNRPWDLNRIIGLFTGFFAFILVFFRTLFEPLTDAQSGGFGSRRGDGGGGGGGGGRGGGDGRGGRGPPRPPQRRIGRITTLSDCTIPGGG